jgi:hypothetical protein
MLVFFLSKQNDSSMQNQRVLVDEIQIFIQT